MGARNTRLLRVSKRAAAFCWAAVWAVLLSVQLHPRQPVGRGNAGGLKPGKSGRLGRGHFGTSGPAPHPGPCREAPSSPLSRPGQVWVGVGHMWVGGCQYG